MNQRERQVKATREDEKSQNHLTATYSNSTVLLLCPLCVKQRKIRRDTVNPASGITVF